jgi:hypothetical protein
MKENQIVIKTLVDMTEESQNYIYFHVDTDTNEISYIAKGDSEVLLNSLVQTFENDKNLYNLVKQAIFTYEYTGNSTLLN